MVKDQDLLYVDHKIYCMMNGERWWMIKIYCMLVIWLMIIFMIDDDKFCNKSHDKIQDNSYDWWNIYDWW
jgi:hypothetical protein